MINKETFEEMLEKIPDKDFILKVLIADVLIIKTGCTDEEWDRGCDGKPSGYSERVVEENSHNGITLEHINYALELESYTDCKKFGHGVYTFPPVPIKA